MTPTPRSRTAARWGRLLLGAIATLALVGTQAAFAAMGHGESTSSFQTLDQPLSLKIMVTVGGLALIALELWWFLGNHRRSAP
jgi:plastocyanin domain-containing protein